MILGLKKSINMIFCHLVVILYKTTISVQLNQTVGEIFSVWTKVADHPTHKPALPSMKLLARKTSRFWLRCWTASNLQTSSDSHSDPSVVFRLKVLKTWGLGEEIRRSWWLWRPLSELCPVWKCLSFVSTCVFRVCSLCIWEEICVALWLKMDFLMIKWSLSSSR